LDKADLSFRELSSDSLVLDNASKLDQVIKINEEAVIQDYSSQRVGEFLQTITQNLKSQNQSPLWDCCAGSGGKSIMAYDLIPNLTITVSDIRSSILSNLKKRFTEAGIKNYHSFATDLTKNDPSIKIQHSAFDIILADVPCTGSGTWSRTPEQLYYFNPSDIEKYSNLQKKVVQHVIPKLKPGGYFLYITCSVFKLENEEVVAFISDQCGLKLKKMELLKGYDLKADSMFVALFTL
jgi:16S rRNA (cytosine967-C5)-methyltransferase